MTRPDPIARGVVLSGEDALDYERGVTAGWFSPEMPDPMVRGAWPVPYRNGFEAGWRARQQKAAA